METPRHQRSIFSIPQDQDKLHSLCLVDDAKNEVLIGTPRQYQELLLTLSAQDDLSPYRLMALAAVAQNYTKRTI